ncbi:achain structural determinant protein [Chrysochromulina tobinii]|uniref:Achain structural determinant protein n=1 Tax=Chrysochromulina tobinii TaxID=1460289 RepID=A0A0M0J3A5_9EUKA|nr:achain structural determinant protein [Chrysochromulina tobinii]|eukprot:KOO20837.1 achain structural determinant protein [Chrysochromulina sp. CCMP291]
MSAQDAFAIFDSDGDGKISIDELKELLNMGTGSVLSDEEVEAIIAEVDVNGNGTLEFDEFEQMWKLFGAGAGPSGGTGGTGQRAPARRTSVPSGEPEVEAEGEWSTAKWLASLGVSKLISRALQVPPRDVMPAFEFVRRLGRSEIERLLNDANLGGLVEMLWDGVEALGKQKVASSAALNDKFQASGKFQMSYGSLSLFYGGLESLIGPPQMHKDPEREGAPATLLKAMENEHCAGPDAIDEFTSTNGVTTQSWLEWEIVVCPKKKPETPEGVYPERKGLREHQPECCRVPRTLDYMCREMESNANVHLRKANHAEMIVEELIAGRLYTGPMYMKYNAVLRAKSGNPYLQQQCRILCKENDYPTSIHATNSCVLKLSKLTKAGKVWRGIKDGTLPKEFWVPNEMGVRGGIEYGFSSTTTDKKQALQYASHGCKDGDAMTIFEMQMGMVDRGADLTWLSQYPHEREVLLPPLTGIEALTSDVEGSMLLISARLSLNLSAQTLEQVLSRRRKMLMDMAAGIELELRDSLGEANYPLARKILRKALEFGAYMYPPEWFNNDDNFSKVMQETLYLQRTLTNEISQLRNAFDRAELNLRGWKARGPARVMLLSGWMHARSSLENVFIDLRDAELTPDDAVQLAHLMTTSPKLTSIDVRGNDSMGERGANAFVDFMAQGKVRTCNSVPRSINGVTHSRSQLQIPKQLSLVECRLLCAELEANVFSEGVSAGMGESSKKGTATLNRRGGSASDSWQPLLWAAKDNNLIVAEMLIAKGHSVNTREPIQDKGNSGYTPLHWAAHKGHLHMVELLLSHGANAAALDKHNNTPKMLAEKKGEKELVALLEGAASRSVIAIKRRPTKSSSEAEQATRPSLDETEPSLFASGWAVPIRDDVLRSALPSVEALQSMIAPAPLYES